jgi:hypothetical protein
VVAAAKEIAGLVAAAVAVNFIKKFQTPLPCFTDLTLI